MGSYTKEMHRQMDDIHNKIVAAHRAGVCDKNGESVKDENGIFKPKPRNVNGPRSFDPTDTFLERYQKGLIVI